MLLYDCDLWLEKYLKQKCKKKQYSVFLVVEKYFLVLEPLFQNPMGVKIEDKCIFFEVPFIIFHREISTAALGSNTCAS